MAADSLDLPPADIGFVSSNFWDVSGAGHFGFQSSWINRSGAIPDLLGYRPVAVLAALTELSAHC